MGIKCVDANPTWKDFAEGSKILLDIDLKIILLGHQNNFVGTLKIMQRHKKF